MCTCRQIEEFIQKAGFRIFRMKRYSWRTVLKWNLESWGLNVSIELKLPSLSSRCIKT